MDAPIYSAATAYTPPTQVPYEQLDVENVSLAELQKAPDAWAIVLKHAPAFGGMVTSNQLKPLLSNFTVESFITYGVVTKDQVEAINADFHLLPKDKWPTL